MVHKTLFIFYYFGDGYAAGIQNYRFISGLENKNFEYKIIYRYSKALSIPGAMQVSAPKFAQLNRFVNFVFPGIISAVSLDEVLWAFIVSLKINRKYKDFDSIHIVSSPFFVQFIGSCFKAKGNRRWIAQLLDPVLDNVYLNERRITKFILGRIEKKVIEGADLIITNSKVLDTILKKRYENKKSKLVIIPPLTESRIVGSNLQNDRLTIIHAGNFYGHRTLDYLTNAMQMYNEKYGKINTLEIELIGNCSNREKEKVTGKNLEDQIKFVDYLDKNDLYFKLGKADAFLVIDAMNHDGIFFPTKLCEYFSFKKIILAITPKRGVTSDLLLEAGHLVFTEGDEEKLADSLFNLQKDRSYYNYFNIDFYKNFLPDTIAKYYMNALGTIVTPRAIGQNK